MMPRRPFAILRRRLSPPRTCLGVWRSLAAGIALFSFEAARVHAEPSPPALLAKYCVVCHGRDQQEAELDLDQLSRDPVARRQDARRLETILQALTAGDMPPADADVKLPQADRTALAGWLRSELAAIAAAEADDPGFVVIPRLTKSEYRYVMRDLSGGVVLDAGRFLPNEGGAGEGFGNVGEAQSLSMAQLEKFLEAGKLSLMHLRITPHGEMLWRTAQREPVDDPAAARLEAINDIIAWHVAMQERYGSEHRQQLQKSLGDVHAAYLEAAWRFEHRTALGLGDVSLATVAEQHQPPLVSVALEKWHAILTADPPPPIYAEWAEAWRRLPAPDAAASPSIRDRCREIVGEQPGRRASKSEADAESKKRNQLLRKRNVSEANKTKVGLNAERNIFESWQHCDVRYLGGPWPEQEAEQREPLAPYHYTRAEILRIASSAEGAELAALEQRLVAVLQIDEQDLLALAKREHSDAAREGVFPTATEWSSWSPESRQAARALTAKIETQRRAWRDRLRPLVAQFARQAWRRPVAGGEVEELLRLFSDALEEGLSFDSAAKLPLLAALTSPRFLYRGVGSADRQAGPTRLVSLTDVQLATRLSFFLWSSIPDEELLALAATGELRARPTLLAQTHRMLRDPRAAALAADFAGQLFGFAEFHEFTGPDEKRFPEFTPALRRSMAEEVQAFFLDLIRHDRPLSNLIDADYVFVNADLARHYGIDPVAPDQWVRVSAPPERGGLPSMALFLTKTSTPLRTSPVKRGEWVLEKLLGQTLKSPPPNIESISADETNAAGLSIREQLEQHRASKVCASCHDRIDPLGIALEGFDPIGRRRSTDRDGSPLSTQATALDGTTIEGIAGLKAFLRRRQEAVYAHITRKLLGYALGRAIAPGDRPLLERIAEAQRAGDSTFSSMVAAIVASPQFLTRRVPLGQESE